MITLKEIKRYQDTNSVEATWVDGEVVVKCHSYDQVQMDMLAADLGADLAEYQWIIDEVQANMIPVPVPDPVPNPKIAELKSELAALDIKRIRPTAEGDTAYLITLNAQAVALRAELQALL